MKSSITAVHHADSKRRAQYLKRFAQVYGVRLDIKRITGNPTVEFIREVKQGNYDLVIVKKDIRELQRSQLRRLVHLWTGSVLVV